MAQRTVGVDFGTSTTLIAESASSGRPEVIPIGRATSWMPSVAVERDSQLLVAEEASDISPAAIVNSVKSCITKRLEWVHSADGSSCLNADEVIVAILKELALRARAERLPIADPSATRLGCPAMWDASQRARLRGLAERAGFAVGPATLIDEPIAAGLTWIENQSRLGLYLEDARVLVSGLLT